MHKHTIEELTILKNKLEQELEMLQAKAAEQELQKQKNSLLHRHIFNTTLQFRSIIDITFIEDGNELLIFGKPPIISRAQGSLRYTTPYNFLKNLLESQLKGNFKHELLNSFSKKLIPSIKYEKGLCLTQREYNRITSEEEIYEIKPPTALTQKTYYLVSYTELGNWETDSLRLTKERQDEAMQEYIDKKIRFVERAMDILQGALSDEDNIEIICAVFAKFLLNLLNQKSYGGFAEEGNTIGYEIRLYPSIAKAEKAQGPFRILTNNEIDYLLSEGTEDLNNKIRIAYNDTGKATQVTEALLILNDIMLKHCQHIEDDELIAKYNEIYNTKLNLSIPDVIIDSLYNTPLDKTEIIKQLPYHIAKQLYFVFDFKPLESKVFVPKLSKESLPQNIEIFTSEVGSHKSIYSIKDGYAYRSDQRNSTGGDIYEVACRKEETDQTLLAIKAIDHLNIFTTIFQQPLHQVKEEENSFPSKILDTFCRLIAMDNQIDWDSFSNTVSFQEYWPEPSSISYDSGDIETMQLQACQPLAAEAVSLS